MQQNIVYFPLATGSAYPAPRRHAHLTRVPLGGCRWRLSSRLRQGHRCQAVTLSLARLQRSTPFSSDAAGAANACLRLHRAHKCMVAGQDDGLSSIMHDAASYYEQLSIPCFSKHATRPCRLGDAQQRHLLRLVVWQPYWAARWPPQRTKPVRSALPAAQPRSHLQAGRLGARRSAVAAKSLELRYLGTQH